MLKATICGNIGKDAEVKQFDNGRSVISFDVCHTEKFTNAQGVKTERSTWVRCNLWRESSKTAIAQYIRKGEKILVIGQPSARAWTDKEGKAMASLEVQVYEVELLGGAKPQVNNGQAQGAPLPSAVHSTPGAMDDDLPF